MQSLLQIVKRNFWLKRVKRAWRERSVVWLAGVRRVGKSCLCQTLENIEYIDCKLPRVRRMMEDPEAFLHGLRGRRIVLDEIHRLQNPSEMPKIAADHYRQTTLTPRTSRPSAGATLKAKPSWWLRMLNEASAVTSETLPFVSKALPAFVRQTTQGKT